MKNAFLFVFLLCSCVLFAGEQTHGFNQSSMDPSVKACDNFYLYANGTWLKNNPIPPDRSSWGAGSELSEKNLTVLHQILENAAEDTHAPAGSIKQKVGTFYRLGMDEKKIEDEGIKPLQPEFDRISAIQNPEDLVRVIGHLHRNNINPAFGYFVYQDFKNSTVMSSWLYQSGLGMPDRDYYTSDDEKMQGLRKEYVAHV